MTAKIKNQAGESDKKLSQLLNCYISEYMRYSFLAMPSIE